MLKMKKQGVEFDEVFDLFAVRIILVSDPDKEKSDMLESLLNSNRPLSAKSQPAAGLDLCAQIERL